MSSYRRKAYAKINIGLSVGKKMDNGFHPIRSYFALLDFSDDLAISVEDSDSFSCVIKSNVSYLEEGKCDIMEKCAKAFSDKIKKPFSININIDKHIPSKAGLGGGSSDGAAVLKVLNEHFGAILDFDSLLSLALSVGSDIPFFLYDTSFAYVTGRGECIKPLPLPSTFDSVLLFFPDEEVSTKGAYQKLDGMDYPFVELPSDLSFPLDKNLFPNDFERVCGSRVLDDVLTSYDRYAYASLSGSGSTVFVLMDSSEKEALMKMAPHDFIVKSFLR